ncbi:IclR family transcriptional regulator [Nocardia salmonicida]|uniref:IclR family transcriptional regulator n=1 Tax=Nocardia salmonicida TaxID=53431 RepID=UPI001041CEFE|nr:IclR family transcriptional regulator [Nocardia salmonicida]
MGAEGIDGSGGEAMSMATSTSGSVGDGSEARPAGMIGAVDNVLRLLALFNESPKIRVNEASRLMGLSRSTVHRMLATLSYHQFVEQDEFSRAYQPGPALIDIGLAVLQNIEIRVVARNALLRLRDETGESVHLGLLRGSEVVFIDSVESGQTVRTGSRIGWTLPAHATATGKVVLAQLGDAELDKLYPDEALDPATSATVQSKSVLREQLDEIRLRGYAVNDGESEPDVGAVAAVIFDRDGRARGAISVTAPRARADAAWIRAAGMAAVRTAELLGASFV